MYTKEVTCGSPECGNAAMYKVAAPWSTGRFSELKSYGLACAEHYGQTFRDAQSRARTHSTSEEETLGEIGIYTYERGLHDKQLTRRKDLEPK